MKLRCDGRVDCEDKSDEEDCGRAVIGSSYNKAMTPPPLAGKYNNNNRNNKFRYNRYDNPMTLLHFSGNTKVSVELSVVLQEILKLDEIGGIMYIKYVLFAKWKDPGLTFHNLKRDANQNLLSEVEWSRIWVPRVTFDNTEATVMDKDAIIRVLANENFIHTTTDIHHHQNSMAWYPLDSSSSLRLILFSRFISVSNALPKTSYVKMIDLWLLFNLTIPFAEVAICIFQNLTLPP